MLQAMSHAIAPPIDAAAVARPVVGVTGPVHGGRATWMALRFAVWRAGGRARRITAAAPVLVADLDAVILSGGDDIDPRRYRRSPTRRMTIDPPREDLELRLIEGAIERDLPLLGICRGMQLLAVAHGGTLFEDIASARRSPLPFWRAHCDRASLLAQVLATTTPAINKIHHQAIESSGEGLVEVAWDEDQLVQGVEVKALTFGLGVQWHPEYLPYLSGQRRLFDALVEAARTRGEPGGDPRVLTDLVAVPGLARGGSGIAFGERFDVGQHAVVDGMDEGVGPE